MGYKSKGSSLRTQTLAKIFHQFLVHYSLGQYPKSGQFLKMLETLTSSKFSQEPRNRGIYHSDFEDWHIWTSEALEQFAVQMDKLLEDWKQKSSPFEVSAVKKKKPVKKMKGDIALGGHS